MGNITTNFETTIVNIHESIYYEGTIIECSPRPRMHIVLKRYNDKYDKFYNMLQKNETFMLECEIILSVIGDTYYELTDIKSLPVHRIKSRVVEIKNDKTFSICSSEYNEIVLSETNSKKFLIEKNQNIVAGCYYHITHVKAFGKNYYKILNIDRYPN